MPAVMNQSINHEIRPTNRVRWRGSVDFLLCFRNTIQYNSFGKLMWLEEEDVHSRNNRVLYSTSSGLT